MGHCILGHIGLKILPRLGLIHIPQHFLKILAVVIEISQGVHHHSGAVAVCGIIGRIDLLVGHGKILPHQGLIGAEVTQIVQQPDGNIVVGIHQTLIVGDVQRCAGPADIGVRGQFSIPLQLIVIHIQRQFIGAARRHKSLVIVCIGLASDCVIVRKGKILFVQTVIFHKIRHCLFQRPILKLRWDLISRRRGRQKHCRRQKQGYYSNPSLHFHHSPF